MSKDFYDHYHVEGECCEDEIVYEIDLNDLTGEQMESLIEVHKRFLMTKTDRGRIKRARQDIRTHRRQIRSSEDSEGNEIIEYDFRANPSTEFRNHWGYVIHDGDDIKEVFCDCKDFFYRLYAPMVKNGLATWDIPKKYKKRMEKFIKPHNHEWTDKTNPSGKLYICKHLYALIQEFVGEGIVAKPLAGVKISPEVKKRLAKDKATQRADAAKSDVSVAGDERDGDKHIGTDDVLDKDAIAADMDVHKAKEDDKAKGDEENDKEVDAKANAEEEKAKEKEAKIKAKEKELEDKVKEKDAEEKEKKKPGHVRRAWDYIKSKFKK